jgi:hypothetical protein
MSLINWPFATPWLLIGVVFLENYAEFRSLVPEQPQEVPAAVGSRPTFKVGQIFIVGNDETADGVIRSVLPFCAGQLLLGEDLRAAERNLVRLGLFEIDAKTGIRPTVVPIDGIPGSQYKDILVQVKEKPTNRRFYAIRDSVAFALTRDPLYLLDVLDRLMRP